MTRYLVTGGSGFIGAGVVRSLLERGAAVRVLDNNSRGTLRRLEDVKGSFDMVEGDIRDIDTVEAATAGVDCVFHLAFINGTRFFYSHPDLVMDVGIQGMLNVVRACRSSGCRELFVASSSEVYQAPPSIPTPEDVPLTIPDVTNPRYSYAAGKIFSEMLALHDAAKDLDRVVVFRPHNIYGPDMGWEHVIPEITMRALGIIESQPRGAIKFKIQGDGTQTRAFMFIDDCRDALMTLLEKAEHRGIYHVGTMDERSIRDVVTEVFALFQRDVEIVPDVVPQGSVSRRCPDISRLRSLGFEPRFALREGLASTVDWYRRHAGLAPAS